ncbi:MAG: 1-deoxy-D-xylulose-5-phosphate reductoisomerase [Paracoccaceae bacterium]
MRRISIFGATGSIGQNTLDLVRRDKEKYQVVALTGATNIDQLIKDALEFRPQYVVTAQAECYQALKSGLAQTEITVLAGAEGLCEAASQKADIAMSAIVGAAGLKPGVVAMENGVHLALANKESMVAAGALMRQTANKHSVRLLPVDSEHSAVFQALIGESQAGLERVILTASGGAFRDWSLAEIAKATPEQAATHPNWDMGQRITIDSASMFNKSLEVIEAKELFDLKPEQIEVVIHPQSMIHALVGFKDGALMAHMGPPDMRHAIGFALNYPERLTLPVERLDLAQMARLDFYAPDYEKYPALRLAFEVLDIGGLAGAVYNGAKEVALDAFIAKQISFLHMAEVVETVLERVFAKEAAQYDPLNLENVMAMDKLGRECADQVVRERI